MHLSLYMYPLPASPLQNHNYFKQLLDGLEPKGTRTQDSFMTPEYHNFLYFLVIKGILSTKVVTDFSDFAAIGWHGAMKIVPQNVSSMREVIFEILGTNRQTGRHSLTLGQGYKTCNPINMFCNFTR